MSNSFTIPRTPLPDHLHDDELAIDPLYLDVRDIINFLVDKYKLHNAAVVLLDKDGLLRCATENGDIGETREMCITAADILSEFLRDEGTQGHEQKTH